jgi:aminopeptidase YwaD
MDMGIAALLIESGEPRWFSKGLQGAQEPSIPVFRLRKEVALNLQRYEGQNVDIDLPLISENLTCQNVLGMIPGADQSKTLVLSAHYDHLGDDPSGVRFPSAIDNSTGVALILELAKKLSAESPLPFNILMAFFTGEESGLLGAKHFVKKTPKFLYLLLLTSIV